MPSNPEDGGRDWRISSLLHDASKRFDEQAKRVGEIIEETRKSFDRDFSGTAMAVGSLALVGSIAASFFGLASVVVGIRATMGAGVLIAGMITRQLTTNGRLRYVNTLVQLERERSLSVQRAAIFEHIWLHGLPEGTTLDQVQLLLCTPPEDPKTHPEEPLAPPGNLTRLIG